MDGFGLCGDGGWLLFPGQTARLQLVTPVLCGVLELTGLRSRYSAQKVSPVPHLIVFTRIWVERAGVRQARAPQVSLLAAGFGCYSGPVLKPLGQLDEAVV